MPEAKDKVMEMVEKELRKNPKTPNSELREKAEKIDKSIAELSDRQFNARYPLQVRRRLAPSGGTRRTGARRARRRNQAEMVDRNAIRGVLLDFARAIAAAEGKADVVDVIGGVDKYVDRVVKATS